MAGNHSAVAVGSAGEKRICFVTTLYSTIRGFLLPQIQALLANGWSVTCICADDKKPNEELPSGVTFISLPFKRGIDVLGVPRAIYILFKIFRRERFHIVQYSTPNAAFYASTAAWMAKIPVRLYAQWGIRYVGFEGMTRRLFKTLERWCCHCSTVVEPDSFSNLEFSIKEGLYDKGKGRVIWRGSACGVDLGRFDVSQRNAWREEYRKKMNLEPDDLVVGFVGSIRRDKGCNELIAACRSFFSDMPKAHLVLIGNKLFYDTIRKDLRDWVESSPQVLYIAPNREIPQYMASMDVFSLPSYREGFGTVIIEAEAMGVPVVVSDVPGPIDAMVDGETGIVVPVKNIDLLAAALRELLMDSGKRELYSRKAAEFARGNFEQEEYYRHVIRDKEGLL